MGKYYIKFGISDKPNAGSKAMQDIMDLLNKQGYKAVMSLPTHTNKLLKIADIPILLLTIIFCIRKNGILIYFVPSNPKRILMLKYMQRILGFRLICFINDIEFMRMKRNEKQMQVEINAIASANIILVPNESSINILQKDYKITKKLIPIGVWDYLSPSPTSNITSNKTIAFAGNLDKAPFLKQLSQVELLFSIWGKGKDMIDKNANVIIKGERKPNELINEICHCSWGLVWDGDSINSCTGLLGNYLRFNNSHKCGLYLAAGIPVIVWKYSGMAHFVKKHQVGICVESLHEVKNIIEQMNENEYTGYSQHAKDIGKKIRKGYFFLEALKSAENTSL